MRIRPTLIALALVALVAAPFALRRPAPSPTSLEAVVVARGDLVAVQREAGQLAPRAPVLVKATMPARLQSIVEDGAWVERGERLFVLSDDEAMKTAADDRASLLQARQELRLARLKRAHAAGDEDRKVAVAKRAADLEELRLRIMTATPVGGDELLKLDAELAPLEKESQAARDAYSAAQDAWQAAFDAHLDALDALQDARDAALRAQAHVDELAARADVAPEDLTAAERAERDQATRDVAAARDEVAAREKDAAALVDKAAKARAARDALTPARDAAAAALAAREAAERDLRVRLEIEKRGLTATKLKLDREAAALALEEAQRKRDDGRAAAQAGALSKLALDDLEAAVADRQGELDVLDRRVEIASRPPAPEVEAEAREKRDRAAAAAQAAVATRERNLAIADQEIAVLEARCKRLEAQLDTRASGFASLIEASLEFARKQSTALDSEAAEGIADDVTERRAALDAEVASLEARLASAKSDPPNVFTAPVAGVVHVARQDDRAKQAGDRVFEEDVVVELYPPTDMEVAAAVNEVAVGHLRAGLRCDVAIPALGDRRIGGVVDRVSGLGKDKFATMGSDAFADVTQFDLRVRLDATGDDFRQGMTALVAIETDRREKALWLPLGAVTRDGDAWTVLTGEAKAPTRRAIRGEPFAEDRFVIADGLSEGETVWVERTRNE